MIDDRSLSRIHARNNEIKFASYLTGFLEGILASRELEEGEIPPLLQQCAEFADKFGCPDSFDVIDDFKADLLDYDSLESLVQFRALALDRSDAKTRMNRFLGMCAGVACDNQFNIHEAERLLEYLRGADDLLQNPHIDALQILLADVVEDGIVDDEEARQMGDAISKIVGDCFADTGISAFETAPSVFADDRLTSKSELPNCIFVLTGQFAVRPRKLIEKALIAAGAAVSKTVTKEVTHVVIAGAPSRDWLYTHGGTKISRAYELQSETGMPFFVSEANIMRFIQINQ